MDELEIMRQQLAAMKHSLDSQQIVNRQLMRKVMRSKASWLNRFVNVEIILIPVVYILIAAICAAYDISQWFSGTFLIFGAIDTALDWRTVRIPPRMFSDSSIIDLGKFLMRQKKERMIQTCVMYPLTLIWLIAFVSAMLVSTDMSFAGDYLAAARQGGIIGGIIGGLIGLVVIVIIFRKMQHTNDTLLSDLHEQNEQ